ncbi:MAG: thiamine pyrophosphate-dependent enzyme [Geopsychrobacter sp.]|nr:thiamine pyrophosphate-dependent enzyme [Geopsychrobacter sp.]
MRSERLNVPVGVSGQFSAEISLQLFHRMSRVRYFEAGIVDAINKKELSYPVYLSSGPEALAAAPSLLLEDCQIFAQHRAHDLYLCIGGSPERLRDELLGRESGTSQGRAGSNCLQYHGNGINMYGHHGLIGENVPQGVGAALGNKKQTLCVFGDGSAEEDYLPPSLGFAATHKLPILFVCVDNDLSILTPTEVRRNWSIRAVAESFGLPAVDLADDPWALLQAGQGLIGQQPALLNCRVCRSYWHVGAGDDGAPEWDRLQLVRNELKALGLESQAAETEIMAQHEMEIVWDRKLLLKR